MEYLDADGPENLLSLATVINGLDRNAITVDNSISLTPNLDNIYTATELSPEPYDPNEDKSWWAVHWKKALQWIAYAAAVLATAIVTIINPVAGAAMAWFCIKGAISGLVIGGIIGGVMSAAQGGNFWDGAADGALYGAINGYTTAAILFGIQSIVHAVKAANMAKSSMRCDGTYCFVAGTLVLTKDGQKAIEDIKEGDLVWAYDEEAGENDWKSVVQLFRNESDLRTTLSIKAEDGTIDEIISTPGHKYYLPDNKRNRNANEKLEHASYEGLSDKWVSACDLKKGDRVLLSDGKYGIVIDVKTEQCEKFTTYNFEVADFHTYYVGENGVLVHNAACDWKWGEGSFDTPEASLKYHAKEHAGKLGIDPTDTTGYLNKAQNFAETVTQRGVKPGKWVEGFTSNVRAYTYTGKTIWIDKANKIIINFFVPG